MDRSMMDRTANVSWTDILGALHQSVRKAVLDVGREAIGTRNAKGDEVKAFDLPQSVIKRTIAGFWRRVCGFPRDLSSHAGKCIFAPAEMQVRHGHWDSRIRVADRS